jgi:hypothetical protein
MKTKRIMEVQMIAKAIIIIIAEHSAQRMRRIIESKSVQHHEDIRYLRLVESCVENQENME